MGERAADGNLTGVASWRVSRLVSTMTALTGALRDPASVLPEIVAAAREVAEAEYAALGVTGADGRLDTFVHEGMAPDLVARIGDLPVGRGLLGRVVTEGRTIRLRRAADSPHSAGVPPAHPPVKAFLGVPLRAGGQVLGNLYLANKLTSDGNDGEFSDDDEALVTALAAQASVVLVNAAAFEREQQLVAELRLADEAKEAFVHHVAHELKTPLVTVRAAVQALQTGTASTPPMRAKVEQVLVRQVDAMADMVNHLLELARIESGRAQLDMEPVDLHEAVTGALAAAPPPGGREVAEDVPSGLMVLADRRYIDRVITNLLLNAYTHGGPHVWVDASAEDGFARLRVSDDGPGVPEELVPTLFDRFAKGTSSKGTGLGLGLVRSIAERFGGGVLHRPRDGGGAVFEVTLQRAVVDPGHG